MTPGRGIDLLPAAARRSFPGQTYGVRRGIGARVSAWPLLWLVSPDPTGLGYDWEHSHALDLSDAGLRADLEGRAEGTAERLAIEC